MDLKVLKSIQFFFNSIHVVIMGSAQAQWVTKPFFLHSTVLSTEFTLISTEMANIGGIFMFKSPKTVFYPAK